MSNNGRYLVCTSKTPYLNRDEAQRALRLTKRLAQRHRSTRTLHIYRCPICCQWHLTSRQLEVINP